MTDHANRWLAIAFVALVGIFIYDGKAGAVQNRTRAVEGCERSRVDRATNRAGWRTAELARRSAAADPAQASGRAANLLAAARYADLVADLTSRIDPPFACQKAYPKPTFLWIPLGRDVAVSDVRALPHR